MKLHFFSNDDLQYISKNKFKDISATWKLILQWKKIASKFKCQVCTGPSPKEKRIEQHRLKYTDNYHQIPARHRTILEVNNNNLVFFDGQDWMNIGAELSKVPDLFSLCIKLQYGATNDYSNAPFKVVPFTYFSPSNNDDLIRYRAIRKNAIKDKYFKHSIMWAGKTKRTGNRTRHAIQNRLLKCSKSTVGITDWDLYLDRICQSAIGASTRGIGEFCHRDIEFMAIGTPFFRKTFKTQTRHPLVPNVHYYSIGGDEVGIDKTMEHFIKMFEPNGEIKEFDGAEWDKYLEISNNSMKWYDQNAHPEASFKLLLDILEENNL